MVFPEVMFHFQACWGASDPPPSPGPRPYATHRPSLVGKARVAKPKATLLGLVTQCSGSPASCSAASLQTRVHPYTHPTKVQFSIAQKHLYIYTMTTYYSIGKSVVEMRTIPNCASWAVSISKRPESNASLACSAAARLLPRHRMSLHDVFRPD